jgi:ABC-type branched-subunit amino acid transport system substrate-binding protein
VKKANSFEADRVADAIRSAEVSTPAGKMAYDTRGDLTDQRIYVFQVQGDEFVQVYP